MVKVKTNSLSGKLLDYVVYKLEDPHGYIDSFLAMYENYRYDSGTYGYSSLWEDGGPIIDKHHICLDVGHDGIWISYTQQNYSGEKESMMSGTTALEAAMRCYVYSKLGSEVKLPDKLLKEDN